MSRSAAVRRAGIDAAHSVGHGARRAQQRATAGTTEERQVGVGTTILGTLVLAIVVGVFATLAEQGSAWAALLVIVFGILLGMSVLAAIVLATRGAVAATDEAAGVPVDRQLARELQTAAESLGLGGGGAPVGWEALARWLLTTPATVAAWIEGRESIPDQQQPQVRTFVDMATTLADNMRPERLPAILATRPVLMLGGRTYFQALNDGAPLEVVADSARLTIGGEDVATDEARSYARRGARVLWSPEQTPTVRPVRRRPS